ncbi:MAG: Tox-REase-5 domain-containing protein, partial [Gemmataceae bacterium]|nr:Tox-REase-5 domain-containing protein [Gemmataceae bacterium]
NSSWSTLSGSAYGSAYLHQGGRFEAVTGSLNFGYRELFVSIGRWGRPDPLGLTAGDANLYRYVHNAPINNTDPSGLSEGFRWFDLIPFSPLISGPSALIWRERERARAERLEEQRIQLLERMGILPPIEFRVAPPGPGTSTVGSGLQAADPSYAVRAQIATARCNMLANVAIMWNSSGPVFVSGNQFTYNFRAGRWQNAQGQWATSAEVRAALREASVGGPGAWVVENTVGRSHAAMIYEQQITGHLAGWGYRVARGRVSATFDGYISGVFLEAKGVGYARHVVNGRFIRGPSFEGYARLVDEARRQSQVANGCVVQWHVAEAEAATAIRNMLIDQGISGITVIHTPLRP